MNGIVENEALMHRREIVVAISAASLHSYQTCVEVERPFTRESQFTWIVPNVRGMHVVRCTKLEHLFMS